MRTLLFASLILLAACDGSSTDDRSGSTDGTDASSGSSSSSGGIDNGPPSGTATLSGGATFDVKAAYFRWDMDGDGGVKTDNAWISFADVPATCAEFTDGLNNHYKSFRLFGLNPRLVGGSLEVGEYDNNEDPFKDGAHYVGYAGVTQGGEPAPPSVMGLHTTLTVVENDSIEGSFTVTWEDGTAPLTGTFSVPLCGKSP